MDEKIKKLEEELEKYQKQYQHMSEEFAATKAGSAYGVEYFDIQTRVLQTMIAEIKTEITKLKRKS